MKTTQQFGLATSRPSLYRHWWILRQHIYRSERTQEAQSMHRVHLLRTTFPDGITYSVLLNRQNSKPLFTKLHRKIYNKD